MPPGKVALESIPMSTETETNEATEMGTKPIAEHAWLQKLVGEWKVVTDMGEGRSSEGTESVKNLGGLWAFSEGHGQMPDGSPHDYYAGLGYDVSFKEYRGFFLAGMSSHLWKYVGALSEDGKTMTLDCEGPSFTKDGETAPYRDVIEFQDDDHRTLTSYGQDEKGEWMQFMKASYTRVA